ncbi:hypothetical protein FRC07_013656, partial [Ceratobasidium sp. 392]
MPQSLYLTGTMVVAYNHNTAVSSGQLGRRVVFGPLVLVKKKAQISKNECTEHDADLPSYAPNTEVNCEEQERGRDQSPHISIHRVSRYYKGIDEKPQLTNTDASMSPEIYYESALTTQRGSSDGARKSNSCPPSCPSDIYLTATMVVSFTHNTAVCSGQLGRRIASSPLILTKMKVQGFKEDCSEYDTSVPPHMLKAEENAECKEQKRRPDQSQVYTKNSPQIYYESVPIMQRGGPNGTCKNNSCPPSLGLGLAASIDEGRERVTATTTEEEKVLVRGHPSIIGRDSFQAAYFTA